MAMCDAFYLHEKNIHVHMFFSEKMSYIWVNMMSFNQKNLIVHKLINNFKLISIIYILEHAQTLQNHTEPCK